MRVKTLIWNVQGLNNKNKRSTLKSLINKWGADIICLQETNIEEWTSSLIRQVWGNRWISWVELKAIGTKGGILIMWDKRVWKRVDSEARIFSYLADLKALMKILNGFFRGCMDLTLIRKETNFGMN